MSEETSTTDNKEQKEKLAMCPCCRQYTLHTPVKPNDQLVDQWMACLITGTQFTHTYPIYDGRINITVTRLGPDAVDIENKCETYLNILTDIDWEASGCPVNLDVMKTMSKLCISIVELSVKSNLGVRVCAPADAVKEACPLLQVASSLLKANKTDENGLTALKSAYTLLTSADTVSSVPIDMLVAVVDVHARISVMLMDTGFDNDFWAGIELA